MSFPAGRPRQRQLIRPNDRGRAGCDQDHRMVVPKQSSERMTFRATLEECRCEAQRCIDEFDQSASSRFASALAGLGRTVGRHGGTAKS